MNTNNTASWWYASNNQKRGPFTEAGLRELAQSGQIRAHDWVWQRGMDDWVLASSIEGLVPENLPAAFMPPALPVDADAAQAHSHEYAQEQAQEHSQAAWHSAQAHVPQDADMSEAAMQVDALIGVNQPFYARQWQIAERNNLSISWNWAALFLGVFWMAYRKMYLPCIVFVATTLGIVGGAIALQLPAPTMHALLETLQIAFAVLFGLYGNWVYRWHVQRTLKRINTHYSPEDVPPQIARWGGVSFPSVLAIALLILLATMLMGTMLSTFVDVPEQAVQPAQPAQAVAPAK